ncbi:MAG TPA: ABC transporter permease [Xanthobacteraceae bacterium]|nr:ABC transporter permease [Xanthobacteraceae bacterium]
MSDIAASSARSWWSPYAAAMGDLIEGLGMWELWSTLAWHDIRQRYRRSVIGPFWLTLSMGVMIAGLAYLYAALLHQDIHAYLPYVATGMIVFSLISTLASEGATIFIGSASLILQLRAPLSIYVYQMVWRNLLIFFHNISIYALIVLFVRVDIGWNILLAVVGLFLLTLSGVWVGIILGGISARFRDVPPIVGSIMQVAFFLTPVFWTADSLSGRALFVHFNPFYYFIEIVRMPLLGKTPPPEIWLGATTVAVVSFLVAIAMYPRFRARVAYWV